MKIVYISTVKFFNNVLDALKTKYEFLKQEHLSQQFCLQLILMYLDHNMFRINFGNHRFHCISKPMRKYQMIGQNLVRSLIKMCIASALTRSSPT